MRAGGKEEGSMTNDYFPPRHGETWETATPQESGFDAGRLAEAVRFSQENETTWGRDFRAGVQAQMHEPAPYNTFLGPLRDRTGPNGLVLRGGRIVAEWGDTTRADMTFSITKSYLSTCAGLAVDDGLIPDLDAPVRELVDDGGFEPPHNHTITWRHLLQQTSEWTGTLWDKPDLVDRNRDVFEKDNSRKATDRQMRAPGAFWEYNDVRVNVLSLALLHLFGRPLPEVAKEAVLDPIGASDGWSWNGYRNSHVEIDGRDMWSVSGGGHWGGGLFVSAYDLARFGLLYLGRGAWGGRRVLSQHWIEMTVEPCAVEPRYGFLWWLNGGGAMYPSAPDDAFFAVGHGGHLVWVDPAHELVCVTRWLSDAAQDGFIQRVLEALD